MKKILLLMTVAITIACTFDSAAQLKVSRSGQVCVGTTQPNQKDTTATAGTIIGSSWSSRPKHNPDTVASLYIAGHEAMQSAGKIAFGQRGDVFIGESQYVSVPMNLHPHGSLLMNGNGGFVISCNNEYLIRYDPARTTAGAGQVVEFSEEILAPQYLTSSDARLKSNVEPLDDLGSMIDRLAPVSYTLSHGTSIDSGVSPASATSVNTPVREKGHLQYGFIAQEVKEIYPDLVYEDENGFMSIDYMGFIPVLVDAIQSLRGQVKEQQETIAAMQNGDGRPDASGQQRNAVVASLSQNRPNPFKASTVIECMIPGGVSEAFICVYDLNGSQKLRRDITERGNTSVTIEGNRLPAGMYIYTLIIDGVEIDSKRMILTD